MLLHCFYCHMQRGITPFSFLKSKLKKIELFLYLLAMLYFVYCLIQMILFKTCIHVHVYAQIFKFVDTCIDIFDEFLAEVSILIM